MAPELRKRKAPAPPPEPPKKKAAKAAAKVKEAVKPKPQTEAKVEAETPPPKTNGSASKKVAVGDKIDLATFGGELTLNDGSTTTLASLVEESGSGVVLFTYPKASTPGCTKQACFFRDSYEPITAGGLKIYGLSRDSPKSNTTFQEKQKLQYPLICDPKATLISAIGLNKAPSSTQRGVFVVNKEGKVLLAEPGSPQGTVDAVKKLAESGDVNGAPPAEKEEDKKEDEKEEEKEDEKEEKTNGEAAEGAKEDEKEKEKEDEEKSDEKKDE